jgi:putative addiction module killer protein
MERGLEIIILLAGGDKSTQSNDIKKAIELSKEV